MDNSNRPQSIRPHGGHDGVRLAAGDSDGITGQNVTVNSGVVHC